MTGVRQRSIKARQAYNLDQREDFTRVQLKKDGLTVLDPRLNMGQEAFRQVFIQGFLDSYRSVLGDGGKKLGLVHPYAAHRQINSSGLIQEYAQGIKLYNRTGIIPGGLLQKLQREIGVRFFALPILVNFQEKEYPRLTVFGFRIVNTARATARFQLQIWDSRTKQIIWEGTSDTTLARDTFLEKPVRFQEIVEEGWEALIQELPGTQTEQSSG
jgi:hypothetical protein